MDVANDVDDAPLAGDEEDHKRLEYLDELGVCICLDLHGGCTALERAKQY